MRKNLISLRNKYKNLVDGFHKQMGTRCIKDALALKNRNPERVAELLAKAEWHLPYAIAVHERETKEIVNED